MHGDTGIEKRRHIIIVPSYLKIKKYINFLRSDRVHCITHSVSAQRWECEGFDAWPKPRHS